MALRATNVNEEFRPQPSRDRQGAVAPIRHDLRGVPMALRATNVNEEFRPQPSRDRQGAQSSG